MAWRSGSTGAAGLALVGGLGLLASLSGCPSKNESRLARRGDGGPSVVVVESAGGGGPLIDEKEPNDEKDAAQALATPTRVQGTIGVAGDVDRYRFTAAAGGVMTLRVSGAEDADLIVEVQDAAGKPLLRSDNGPAGTVEGAPNLGVTPGEYRVVVSEFVKKPAKKKGAPAAAAPAARTQPSKPYTLDLAPAPAAAPGEEVEPNDGPAFAGELPLGGAASGYVGWRKDRDFWRVALSGAGEDDALAVDVDAVEGVALRVAVLDGTEAVLLERQGGVGDPLALRNVAVRPGEPHYFVVVSGTKASFDTRYNVRAATAPFQLDEESEPNDDVARASVLADIPTADNGVRVGYLAKGDTDVYRLEPAPGPRQLRVTLEPPAGVDGVLTIVDEAGGALLEPADAGKAGAPETQTTIVPPGRPVFVKVTARSGSSATERYRLRWSTLPAAPDAVDEAVPAPAMENPQSLS